MRQVFDGLGCVAVRTDAEGILAVDLEHVGGFVKDAGNRLIVHELKSKLRASGRASFGAHERLPLGAVTNRAGPRMNSATLHTYPVTFPIEAGRGAGNTEPA